MTFVMEMTGRLVRVLSVAVVAAVVLTGCGADERDQSIDTMGTNGQVGEMLLRNVYLEAPEGGIYEPGDDAALRFRLVSHSSQEDRLLAVRSAANEARIRWDRDCDGRFETVDGLRVKAGGQVLFSSAYFVELVDVDHMVRAGTTLPVTFEFEHAGVGTVDAMVESRDDGSQPASLSCGSSPGPAPPPADGDELTVTGTLVAGVEPGCFLLDTGTTRYLLTGADSPLPEPGGWLTVAGIAHPDMPTTCMEGVPLQVQRIQPGP